MATTPIPLSGVMSSQIALRIDTVEVRQDAAGRYCLNDLHKAAGGEARHQPAFFMRRRETADILAALNSADPQSSPASTTEGRNGGTYVCKDLVYDYAMWISAEFRLKVIRTFDAVATGGAFTVPRTQQEALRLAADLLDRNAEQAAQLASQAPKVESFERLLAAGDTLSLRDAAKAMRVPERQLVAMLITDGRLFRDESGRLRAYATECEAGRFTHRAWTAKHTTKAKAGVQVRVTTSGLSWLSSQFAPPPAAGEVA
jgi:phage antirepressor YoqD-like protein